MGWSKSTYVKIATNKRLSVQELTLQFNSPLLSQIFIEFKFFGMLKIMAQYQYRGKLLLKLNCQNKLDVRYLAYIIVRALMSCHFNVFFKKRFDIVGQCLILSITKKTICYSLATAIYNSLNTKLSMKFFSISKNHQKLF